MSSHWDGSVSPCVSIRRRVCVIIHIYSEPQSDQDMINTNIKPWPSAELKRFMEQQAISRRKSAAKATSKPDAQREVTNQQARTRQRPPAKASNVQFDSRDQQVRARPQPTGTAKHKTSAHFKFMDQLVGTQQRLTVKATPSPDSQFVFMSRLAEARRNPTATATPTQAGAIHRSTAQQSKPNAQPEVMDQQAAAAPIAISTPKFDFIDQEAGARITPTAEAKAEPDASFDFMDQLAGGPQRPPPNLHAGARQAPPAGKPGARQASPARKPPEPEPWFDVLELLGASPQGPFPNMQAEARQRSAAQAALKSKLNRCASNVASPAARQTSLSFQQLSADAILRAALGRLGIPSPVVSMPQETMHASLPTASLPSSGARASAPSTVTVAQPTSAVATVPPEMATSAPVVAMPPTMALATSTYEQSLDAEFDMPP